MFVDHGLAVVAIRGLAVEAQLRASLRDPEVSTLPLPVITRPIQEFFDLVADL